MKKVAKKDIFCILTIFAAFVLCFALYFSKLGNPIIDCGREAFIPLRILNGEILFKDIFCVYGAFAYYFNALCYKILGARLETLYFTGGLLGLGIVYAVYFLSREFLNRALSVALSLFIISVCAFVTGVFNFVFPYSYAMLFALFGFLYSLLFLIKYIKEPTFKNAALVFLFWGLSLANKYDYAPFIAPILLTFCYFKPLRHPKSVLFLFIFPLITLFATFINGAGIPDIIQNANYIDKMLKTESLKFFYAPVGVYFVKEIFINVLIVAIKNILVFGILMYLIVFSARIRYKFLRIVAVFTASVLMLLYACQTQPVIYKQFAFFPMLIGVVTLYNFIKHFKDKKEAAYLVLLLSATLASLKNFFCLSLGVYGTYPMTVLTLALIVSLYRFFTRKAYAANSGKYATLALIVFLGAYTLTNFWHYFYQFTYTIKTPIYNKEIKHLGKMYSSAELAGDVNELVDFLYSRTGENDNIVVLPEGQLVNFLTTRNSKVYYDSLTPLYFETFGEDNIIKEFTRVKPKYVVLSDRDTSEYGRGHICIDYGLGFCSYIVKNYEFEAIFGKAIKFFVFRISE